MADKTTVMVLKVDLQCSCCYKKVKKILCKFPQIRNQVYDEKANTVTITVVCCDPEKLRDKLCCKGCKVIKSIEIKEPEKPKPKPKEPEKPQPKEPEKPKVPEKPKEPEKPKVPEKPKEPEKPPAPVPVPVPVPVPEKPKEVPKPAPPPKAPEPAPPPKQPEPEPVPVMPLFPTCGYPPAPFPVRTCCEECYHGHGGGPCYSGYWPPARPPCYDGCYDYGCRRGCHVSRCDYYFSEENPHSCSIM